jgi:DNA-binding MarR family transcriptional regulator
VPGGPAGRPLGLTSGQFSLLNALNRPQPPSVGSVAQLLAMDRTTLTANLKPLERNGLVGQAIDTDDRRVRRLQLTDAGRAMLARAMPVWIAVHGEIDAGLPDGGAVRAGLAALL